MILGILYELKKHIFAKSNLIILLVLTVMGAALLFWNEGGYFFEKAERQKFYAQMGETFSEEDKEKYTEEAEKLDLELYPLDADGAISFNEEEMEKAGKYVGTKLEDHYYLKGLLKCIEIVEKRNRNMKLLSEGYVGATSDYEKEDNHMLADQKKLTAAAQHMGFGLLPCIACIILLCSSFAMEYETHLYPVLCITKKEYWSICIAKILAGVLVAVACNLYFWGVYLGLQFLIIGMTAKDWGQPLFLAEGYQMCASGYTIWSLLARQILASVLVSLLVAMLTLLLSKVIKKSNYALLAALVLFAVMLIPDLLNTFIYDSIYFVNMSNWYIVSEPTFYRILHFAKMINPVSMLQFQYYMEQPQYTLISSYQYPLYCFPILVAVILTGIFGMILFHQKKRGL